MHVSYSYGYARNNFSIHKKIIREDWTIVLNVYVCMALHFEGKTLCKAREREVKEDFIHTYRVDIAGIVWNIIQCASLNLSQSMNMVEICVLYGVRMCNNNNNNVPVWYYTIFSLFLVVISRLFGWNSGRDEIALPKRPILSSHHIPILGWRVCMCVCSYAFATDVFCCIRIHCTTHVSVQHIVWRLLNVFHSCFGRIEFKVISATV